VSATCRAINFSDRASAAIACFNWASSDSISEGRLPFFASSQLARVIASLRSASSRAAFSGIASRANSGTPALT
jgi:hypothetical protein